MWLVYQGYGKESIIRQTQFSVISLLNQVSSSSPLKILIYTDQPTLFDQYFAREPRVQLRVISADEIKKWRGQINFVHRVKVEVLLDASLKFNGPLFYVDGDTFFHADPSPLFMQVNDKTSLMHISESVLSEGKDPLTKKINKFVKNKKFNINNSEIQILQNAVMWNAGAIGISQNNKYMLKDVLALTDLMYTQYAKHVMEQLAFSVVLQNKTKIFAGDHIIAHYWNQKDEYQKLIDQFLKDNSNLDSAKKAYDKITWPVWIDPKPQKNFFQKLFSF